VKAHRFQDQLRRADPVLRTGRVRTILSTHIEADGPAVSLGALCLVEARAESGSGAFQAEVVRVAPDGIVLSPLEDSIPTWCGALVTACGEIDTVPVGHALLGRVVDPLGRPLDGYGPVRADQFRPLNGPTFSPLERISPSEIFETGIRAVDGLLTLGAGQRIGVFAASGVGKTTLMNQIARQAQADVTIICLVGERGREVEALWNNGLDEGARARTTLVAATSDRAAAMRVRAVYYSLALAEYWRSKGKHVLFLLDSATRLALAMREIGLAAGEPPTVRAYTPGVFAALPRIVERCGALRAGGAITAVMTVLSETDDVDDPVSELMKSLLDGHILLSRQLAERGQYPAIDVPRSISRQAEGLVSEAQLADAHKILEWLSVYDASRTLIDTGVYSAGTNASIDKAIERHPHITEFLKQPRSEQMPFDRTATSLAKIVAGRS
jgi:flagellum-specific ATP synthase